jgi:hypothetical protein
LRDKHQGHSFRSDSGKCPNAVSRPNGEWLTNSPRIYTATGMESFTSG